MKVLELLDPLISKCLNANILLAYHFDKLLNALEYLFMFHVSGKVGEDITLTLGNSTSSPVNISTTGASPSLVLVSPLDREELLGETGLTVGIVCNRIGQDDEGLTIPINIHVTDVNDNAPVFLGTPYILNISELSPVGSVLFSDMVAIDADQPGPFSKVQYSVPNGPFSDFVVNKNPLDGKLTQLKEFDYEEVQQMKIKVLARDQGNPPQISETTLTINILDADDQNPAFYFDRYEATIPTTTTGSLKLPVKPQDVKAYDRDVGLNAPVYYSFSGSGPLYRYLELNRNTGQVYIKGSIRDLTNFLLPSTVVVRATQFDNPDRYAVTTINISRAGPPSSGPALAFLEREYRTSIIESFPLGSRVITLRTNKDWDQGIQFQIQAEDLPNNEFEINNYGEVLLRKSLDFETQVNYSFYATVTDGTNTDKARVNISVININDWNPRFKYPQYEFLVREEDIQDGQKVGSVQVFDGDKGDKMTLEIRGEMARVFSITPDGDIVLSDLGYMSGAEAHILVIAQDSGVPPRCSSVPVAVKFEKELTQNFRYRSDAPQILLMWVLSLVLVTSLLIIVSLGLYICRSKKTYSHSPAKALYIQQEFPHEKITRLSSTMSRIGPEKLPTATTTMPRSHIAIRTAGPTIYNPLNPRSGSNRYNRHRDERQEPTYQPAPNINECGLPSPPDHYTLPRSSSTGNLVTTTSHQIRPGWPRASIPRTVKKFKWEDKQEVENAYLDPRVAVTPIEEANRNTDDIVYLN